MKRLRRIVRIIAVSAGITILTLAAMLFAALRPPTPLPAPDNGFELESVTLVEPGGSVRGPVRLKIEDGIIASIMDAPSSDGDAPFTSHFVLPGLTDVHAHLPALQLPGDAEYTSLLMLLHGVTRVRFLGGVEVEFLNAYRKRIENGEAPGPRYFNCGPFIDGPNPVLPGARVVTNDEEARAAVAELAKEGVDCIKAYEMLSAESAVALREAADAHGLPIVGHTPRTVPFETARFNDHQHLRGLHPPFLESERLEYPHFLTAWLRHDEERMQHVIRVSLKYGIAHTPTLSAVDATLQAEPWTTWRESDAMRLWFPHTRDGFWSAEVGFNPVRFMEAADFDLIRAASQRQRETVKALFDAGVPIHTGTDANAPNLVPGASLHRELVLLKQAGLTNEQALEASTRVSPRSLGIEGAGELRVGAPADFIVLKENPLQDLNALKSIRAVSQAGRFYTVEDLRGRIARYQEHYDGFAFRRGLMPMLRSALRITTGWIASGAGS